MPHSEIHIHIHLQTDGHEKHGPVVSKGEPVTLTRDSGHDDLEIRSAIGEEPRARLIVCVPNDGLGNGFLARLRDDQDHLGFTFEGTLGEILAHRDARNALLADQMEDKFAFLKIREGYDAPVVKSVLRRVCETRVSGKPSPDIDVDPDFLLRLNAPPLGPNYNLYSSDSMHAEYKNLLQSASTVAAGKGVNVAVVDTGFEHRNVVSGFCDVVNADNQIETDANGHGTAMATIIRDVAKSANVFCVRVADDSPRVSDAMVGIALAAHHFQADILNLSFGIRANQKCHVCGDSKSGISRAFYRFVHSISRKAVANRGEPILVAATGNSGGSSGFDTPAAWWTSTVAVGSINKGRTRSSFSTFGTRSHKRYIVMPGGEMRSNGPTEWVGEATQKCLGTSVSSAYATAVLALYMSDPDFKSNDRTSFLAKVLANCRPCTGHNSIEHGLGYLPYASRISPAATDTSTA